MSLKTLSPCTRAVSGWLTLAAVLGIAGHANAGGFYLQEHSIKANGRAWSGEVSERGVQQGWWNPASIGGIQTREAYLGLTALFPGAEARNVNTRVVRPTLAVGGTVIPGTNLPVGGDQITKDPVDNGFLPAGGFAMPLNDKIAVGLTLTAPYSFTTNYSGTSWARYSAGKTELRTYDIQPMVAFTPTENLSLGVGLNIEYADAVLGNYLPSPLPNQPDGYQHLAGDGWDIGYSVGLQYHTDRIDFGASYKSAVKHKLKGDLSIFGLRDPISLAAGINTNITGANAEFSTPWQAQVGMRYHVNDRLTLNGQVARYGWSKFDDIALSNLGTRPNQSIPENYKNTMSYSVGADYEINDKLTWRAGVQRDLSPIRSGERDPRVPDGNRWTLATGATYAVNERVDVDMSLGYTKIASNPIDKRTAAYAGTPLQTVILTSGELGKARALVFGVGAAFKF